MTNPNLLVQPEWAKWKATDGDGRMYWYEYKPARDWSNRCWTCGEQGGLVHFAGYAYGKQLFWSSLITEL